MKFHFDVCLHGKLCGHSDTNISKYTLVRGEYVILKVLVKDGNQRDTNSVLMVSNYVVTHFVSNRMYFRRHNLCTNTLYVNYILNVSAFRLS
jgi:hypothetical protein